MKIKLECRGKEIWLESDDNQYVVHDGYNVTVNKDGSESKTKKNPSYLTNFQSAIDKCLEKSIRHSDATTLTELYNHVVEFKNMVADKFTITVEAC
jgi:hypothetical protein